MCGHGRFDAGHLPPDALPPLPVPDEEEEEEEESKAGLARGETETSQADTPPRPLCRRYRPSATGSCTSSSTPVFTWQRRCQGAELIVVLMKEDGGEDGKGRANGTVRVRVRVQVREP